jgi:hypothetical protein
MKTVSKSAKIMSKKRADLLKEKYKNDEDIDYSDIPALDDEMLKTGKVVDYSHLFKNKPA